MAEIFFYAVPGDWRRGQKYEFLDLKQNAANIPWEVLKPDKKHNWLTAGMDAGFDKMLAIGSKQVKTGVGSGDVLFRTFSLGVNTARDDTAYAFGEETLIKQVKTFCSNYNAEIARYQEEGRPANIDNFVNYEKLKWSRNLKRHFARGAKLKFSSAYVRIGLFRPFAKLSYYFGPLVNDERGSFDDFFPTSEAEKENVSICVSDTGLRSPFSVLATNIIANLHLCASSDAFQCFPFYTYNEDGTARRENIPDAAQITFWKHYGDESITKWDLFHYVYGLLHHPGYRERFAGNLRRELPRIPFAPDFRAFADAGRQLAELHVGYETQPEFPLKRVENRAAGRDLRVEKMRFTAPDRAAIRYNAFLTLEGIPPEAHAYRLGNRSALEWVLDQFAVSHDKNSGLTSDPNRPDDETAILRLLGQVITVSVETVKLVAGLPEDFGAGEGVSAPEERSSPVAEDDSL